MEKIAAIFVTMIADPYDLIKHFHGAWLFRLIM